MFMKTAQHSAFTAEEPQKWELLLCIQNVSHGFGCLHFGFNKRGARVHFPVNYIISLECIVYFFNQVLAQQNCPDFGVWACLSSQTPGLIFQPGSLSLKECAPSNRWESLRGEAEAPCGGFQGAAALRPWGVEAPDPRPFGFLCCQASCCQGGADAVTHIGSVWHWGGCQ